MAIIFHLTTADPALQAIGGRSAGENSGISPPLTDAAPATSVLRLMSDCSSIVLRYKIEEQSKNNRRTIEEQTALTLT
ncbi:MAG: hypothetical protein IJ760_05495 [Bacteroidales bacterium]|nr:hypothetical protein [Bacteroidales bacterium]